MLQHTNNILWQVVMVLSLCGSAVSQGYGDVRLADAPTSSEGRVEVFYNSEWYTICDDSFDGDDAEVICRQLGYSGAETYYGSAYFGQGHGGILREIDCYGYETSWTDCSTFDWGTSGCIHSEDVGVVCSTNGYGDVRLVDGSTSSEGRVEIFYNNKWYTICDDSFGSDEADVICRQLGYSGAETYHDSAYYGEGHGPILGNMNCYGFQTSWRDCTNTGWDTTICNHGEDVGIVCTSSYPVSPGYGDVRLADGSTSYEGRVEVFYNSEWYTICDDYFDGDDAEVICRQLGYSGAEIYYGSAYFGEGYGPILRDIGCYGYETSWIGCSTLDWGTSSCSHSEDVGVVCSTYGQETVRLVDDYSSSQGRVEIYNEGDWGTICDDNFDMDDANVLCRQLGYSRASSYGTVSYFDQGSGPIMESLDCYGYESDWRNCYYRGWDTSTCSHTEDVEINCTDGGPVVGIVVGVIIIVLICICCCSICVFAIKTSTRSRRSRTPAAGVTQLATTQPGVVTHPPPPATAVMTNQTTGDDGPPSYKDVISNPVTYPVQTNPAYPPQNYPQQPYPTQQGVTYPVQPGMAPYPTPYPSQTGVAPYPAQPAIAPYPPQSNVAPHPPQSVNPNQPPAAAPIYPPPGTQSEMYPQQGNPQSEPSAPPVQSGDVAPHYESTITPSESVEGTAD